MLNDSQQLFASKYQFTLPSEDELQRKILRERSIDRKPTGTLTASLVCYFGVILASFWRQ